MLKFLLLTLFVSSAYTILANDTLLFKINVDWKKIYDNSQSHYVRKAVLKDSGCLALDYTLNNKIFHKGYYTDTTFERSLYCHEYFDTSGNIRCLTYYENYNIHTNIYFDEKGDTLQKDIFKVSDYYSFLAESKDFRTGITRNIDTPWMYKIDVEAEFPGGNEAWRDYIINHIRYPRQAYKNKIEGTVIVQFIVEKDGSVSNVVAIKHVDPLLDEEAIRLIKKSPNWIPAKRSQQYVRSQKIQPITFGSPKR